MALTAVFTLIFTALLSYGNVRTRVYAAALNNYEKSNVYDDLCDMTIDAQDFDINNYGYDSTKELQVIALAEYGYAFSGARDSFGLYVYIYNPQNLTYNLTSGANQISLRINASEDESFHKYPLIFLNASTGPGLNNLFFKFYVDLDLAAISRAYASDVRSYEIGEVELKVNTGANATAYPVGKTYKYTGYAKGFGATETAASTLKSTSETFIVLPLEVTPTYYRPDGHNGKNIYTQDSLHSVFFAVPNTYLDKFGDLYSVHATWLNAILNPALVTGNQDAYQAIKPYLGVDIGSYTQNIDYAYIGYYDTSGVNKVSVGYVYNLPDGFWSGANGFWGALTSALFSYNMTYDTSKVPYNNNLINKLCLMTYSGDAENSADSFVWSSEEILNAMLAYPGEKNVLGKYSSDLFYNVDESFTDITILSSDEFKLTSTPISQSWWQKLWGSYSEGTTQVFDGISGIYAVKESDLTEEASMIADNLKISKTDVEKLKSKFNNNPDCTVFLFRYQISDFFSQEATLMPLTDYHDNAPVANPYVDTNAYFFQQTVNLDFDIIDVGFKGAHGVTIIPAVSNPIDIVHDATPPLITTPDKRPFDWRSLVAILVVALILYVAYRVLRFFKVVK